MNGKARRSQVTGGNTECGKAEKEDFLWNAKRNPRGKKGSIAAETQGQKGQV